MGFGLLFGYVSQHSSVVCFITWFSGCRFVVLLVALVVVMLVLIAFGGWLVWLVSSGLSIMLGLLLLSMLVLGCYCGCVA